MTKKIICEEERKEKDVVSRWYDRRRKKQCLSAKATLAIMRLHGDI